METLFMFVKVFLVGGAICAVGQILLEKTKLTSAQILVLYVTLGAVISAIGLYEPLVKFAGSGASIPLTGFGHTLAQGAITGVAEDGIIGAFTGGVKAAAGGITAAIAFGYLAALLFSPKTK